MVRWSCRLLLVAFAFGARAQAAVDVPIFPPGPHDTPQTIAGPVLLDDGTVVFGVRQSARWINILRLPPGSSTPERITRVALPKVDSNGTVGASVELTGAGTGFFVFVSEGGCSHYCSVPHVFYARLLWFAGSGGPGIAISTCSGDCGDAGRPADWLHLYAADAGHAVLGPGCDPTGPCHDRFVRDLATGTDTPLPAALDWVNLLAGRYVVGQTSDGVAIVDWTTGDIVRTTHSALPQILQRDGTLLWHDVQDSSTVSNYRLSLGDDKPVSLPVEGYINGVAGDRILTVKYGYPHSATLYVWNQDGTPLGQLAANDGPFAFDGHRVLYLDHACATARLQEWTIGASTEPVAPKPICGPARVAGKVALGPRSATVTLRCPTRVPQGCVGAVSLADPLSRHARRQRVVLVSGQRHSYTLLSRLMPDACKKLARTRAWTIKLETDTVFGRETTNVPAARRNHCSTISAR